MKYQGRVFHVQTEDSGIRTPRVVTHLFIGGTIIATVKTPYDAQLSRLDLKTYVIDLMQSQHKAMLKSLIHGDYDGPIGQSWGSAAKLDGPAPLNVAAGQNLSSFARQSESAPPPLVRTPPPQAPASAAPVTTDAARPNLQSRPPPLARTSRVPPPRKKPASLPRAPIPEEEQGYAEAQLIEPDDQAVDSLFGNLANEKKTLDEVIQLFLGTDKSDK